MFSLLFHKTCSVFQELCPQYALILVEREHIFLVFNSFTNFCDKITTNKTTKIINSFLILSNVCFCIYYALLHSYTL